MVVLYATTATVLKLTTTTTYVTDIYNVLVQHVVVWHCVHVHCTEGMVGKASKKAIDIKCSLE